MSRKDRSRQHNDAYGADRIEQRELHPRDDPDRLTLLEIDTIEAVASNDAIYHLATVLPVHQPGTPGRRPHYPPWVHVLHKALAGVLGSHSKAARAMAHPAYWRTIRHRNAGTTTTPNGYSTSTPASCSRLSGRSHDSSRANSVVSTQALGCRPPIRHAGSTS